MDGGGGADPGSTAAALPETLEEAQELVDEVGGGEEEEEDGDEGGQGLQEAGGAELDYSALRVVDLKALLRERGLPVSGRKAELVARLAEAAE